MLNVIPAGFMPYNEMLYSLVGACLFSFYLAYHTKLIVAGKHAKYLLNEKDYVFGASKFYLFASPLYASANHYPLFSSVTLYNDIINIFIYTLRLIGEDKGRRR